MKLNTRQAGNYCLEILDVDLTQVDEEMFASLRWPRRSRPVDLKYR